MVTTNTSGAFLPRPDKARQRIDLGQKPGLEHRLAGRGFQAQQHVVVVVAEAAGVLLVVVQVRVAGGVEVVEIVVEAQLSHEEPGQGREQSEGQQREVRKFAKGHRQGPEAVSSGHQKTREEP